MQDFLKQKTGVFATWLGAWCKDNIDFAFILAVFTETPRWTVTFMAIHEPLWIGIPLGVLLAFATSKVWKYYFTTRNVWSLRFNIAAIVLAMLVITPVLYAMTETSPKEVNVTLVFADLRTINPVRMVWAASLALLTFVPLVQLAAVHGIQTQPAQDKPQQRSAQPKPPVTVTEQPENTQPQSAQETDDTINKRQRAIQLRSEGLSYAQIAGELDVHRNTISNWLKATNGHKEPTQ